ncbi:phosphatidylinositol-specific phospholipase C domain-containing protein [Thalassomonas sp. RHCl1]|uniref:phosphatidylinositol-specific phospholipase C domain-containing protein n=1 Tax=Thalassomonas sp. RHCl1 TaxID=2995320 RepID=UPI00248C3419|nr:phosphatidylinositol-specific phospholipase C domain-containing protein [Thalassomonas sp. RHCl1]
MKTTTMSKKPTNKKALMLAITAAAGTFTASADQLGPYHSQDWVGQIYQNRGDTRLRDIVIPGTHDSGTYNMHSGSDLSPDAESWAPYVTGLLGQAGGHIIAKWGRTQSYDIHTMLEKGIRHFDLRIKKHQGEFVIVHTMVAMKVKDVLAQVKQFAEAHPKEPIILEVAKTPDSADMPALLDLFDQYIGQRKPNNSVKTADLTLNTLWQDHGGDGKNDNVVVVWSSSSEDGKSRGYFGAENFTGTWANTESYGELRDRLLTGLKSAPDDKLFYSAFTYTPTAGTIIKDAIGFGKKRSLLNWSQDFLRPYLGELVPAWAQAGYRPNIMTADFFEYTALIPTALQLNTLPPQAPTNKLQVTRAAGVKRVWTDVNSGADTDGSVWVAEEKPGYKPLAYMPITGYHFDPAIDQLLVKADQAGVVRPLGYNWVWDDVGNGGSEFIQVWRPIAPAGYVCLGDVATPSAHQHIAPSTDLIRCVHQSYVAQAPSIYQKWTDKDSGGTYDGSLWDSANHNGSTYNIGALRTSRGYAQPDNALFQLLLKSKTVEM